MSNWMSVAVVLSSTWMMVKVEYATLRTLQTGSVFTMVSTHSSMGMPFSIMVERILLVSVERILAFTPLPRPSARTSVRLLSLRAMISTRSPQSCSPFLFRLT